MRACYGVDYDGYCCRLLFLEISSAGNQPSTRLTDEEKQEKIDRFGAENSELGERVKNGDEAAYQEYQAKFQRQEITTKYDSETMTSDEKLRKRQNAFQTDSQLRMAIGDEELLAIMDSPNLSFKPDFSGEN